MHSTRLAERVFRVNDRGGACIRTIILKQGKVIRDTERPKTKKQVKSFSGVVGFKVCPKLLRYSCTTNIFDQKGTTNAGAVGGNGKKLFKLLMILRRDCLF